MDMDSSFIRKAERETLLSFIISLPFTCCRLTCFSSTLVGNGAISGQPECVREKPAERERERAALQQALSLPIIGDCNVLFFFLLLLFSLSRCVCVYAWRSHPGVTGHHGTENARPGAAL